MMVIDNVLSASEEADDTTNGCQRQTAVRNRREAFRAQINLAHRLLLARLFSP